MNASPIGALIRLRYKLLWAKTRSRNGRIALFLVGYLFLVLLLVVMGLGGFGAGLVAIRSGKAELLAQGVLGGLFLNAMLGSVILGFGLSAGFSAAALRRYPLTEAERMVSEHAAGILDPIWILILGLEIGLALGLYVFGTASFGASVLAVLLLIFSNYLAAKIVSRSAERLMQSRNGAVVLLSFVVVLSVIPSLLAQTRHANAAVLDSVLSVLRYTPPFAAGAVIAGQNPSPVLDFGLLLGWSAWLLAALIALERRPAVTRRAASFEIRWETPADRIGAFFGPVHGPLVARWLRYYWRNTRSRFFYLTAVPLAAFLTGMIAANSRGGQPKPLFMVALATFALVGFMGTGKIAVNLFGYDGPGFKRYFLLPVDATAALRAGSYASAIMSAALIPLAALVWVAFSPAGTGVRGLVILTGVAAASLFLFNALAVWTSILAPRKGDFNSSFGNDLSLGGNLLFGGSVMAPIVSAQILAQVARPETVLGYWWAAAPAAALSAVFYVVSLRGASAVFLSRRERLLHITEGRG